MHHHQLLAGGLAAVGAMALAVCPLSADAARSDKPDRPDKAAAGNARRVMVRDGGAVDDNAKGRIDAAVKRDGRVSLRVQGLRLDSDLGVDFTIEDDLGDEQTFATGTVEDGSVKVFLRTHLGDALPLGATTLDELQGRLLRIRVSATGDALLIGRVPGLDEYAHKQERSRSALDNLDPNADANARGQLRTQWRARDGRSRLTVAVKRVTPGATVNFYLADDVGTLQLVATDTADADGNARWRVRTDQGDPLPFGALSLLELAGRSLRVDVDDVEQLGGALPGDA